MKKRDYVCVTKSNKPGRYVVVSSGEWHRNVSRSSAIRLIRLMKTAKLSQVKLYTSPYEDRWIYWWF